MCCPGRLWKQGWGRAPARGAQTISMKHTGSAAHRHMCSCYAGHQARCQHFQMHTLSPACLPTELGLSLEQ